MSRRAPLAPAGAASPGLLRRRYSVPETIMRKYWLAQMRSESESSSAATSPARTASPGDPLRARRTDPALRKSAAPRRLWAPAPGDAPACASCCCDCELRDERETRSLGGSRAELSAASSRAPAGWATPKRQRLVSPSKHTGSEEMLRIAVRNSYYQERERRDELSSESTLRSRSPERPLGEVPRAARSVESVDQAPKKRKQSVFINMNLSSADVESEATANSTEEGSVTPASGPVATDLTFPASEDSDKLVSQAHGEVFANDPIDARECLSARTESSYSRSEEEPTCIMRIDQNVIDRSEQANHKPASKLAESTMEILEIVVSETNSSNKFSSAAIASVASSSPLQSSGAVDIVRHRPIKFQPLDIDQYVSNILFESLNSLTDQIEEINASMDDEHKISIVEKEIKVKLQNTGMNTVVHLSPNSNNPIIFGHKELYDQLELEDSNVECIEDADKNSDRGTIKIELTDSNDFRLTDSSENVTHISAKELENDEEFSKSTINNENVNKSVLQQIKKLFQDGFDRNIGLEYPGKMVPEISHIEISNVDVFIDDNTDPNFSYKDEIEINTNRHNCQYECNFSEFDRNFGNCLTENVLTQVGTGTSYYEPTKPVLVPRFSAFPNTESMEVNASSSEDADFLGSDCTSLVDSLDDPNSPRNILLRRVHRNNRRSELVRSAIDVLDLLPEMSRSESRSREKSESFFIRITDGDCDCEKENVVVADHMPDKIRQRLFRRHKKRELRMEYAKRKKIKQIKRELEKQNFSDYVKTKKEIERDCKAILQSLVDEVLEKIIEEEYKYTKIRQTDTKNIKINSDKTNTIARKQKVTKQAGNINKEEPFKAVKDLNRRNGMSITHARNEQNKNTNKVKNKSSLHLKTPETPAQDRGPKRFYQKSEFHDGNKCIEILEILEYANSSQSSSDVNNSEEKNKSRVRKSRIPIPVYESLPNNVLKKPYKHFARSSPNLKFDKNTDNLEDDMLVDSINDNSNDAESLVEILKPLRSSTRRASVPQQESQRSRSNSLRFKQMFDIIPEEKSSISIESSMEDVNFNNKTQGLYGKKSKEFNNNKLKREDKSTMSDTAFKISKSTSTSPSLINDGKKLNTSRSASISSSPAYNNNTEKRKRNEIVKQAVYDTKKSSSSSGKEGWSSFYESSKHLVDQPGIRPQRMHIH